MEEQIVFHNQVIEFFDTKDAKTRLKFLQRATLVAREAKKAIKMAEWNLTELW